VCVVIVLLTDQDVYEVKSSIRGRAIIISNQYFSDSKLQARFGNAADVINLKKLLQSLHFTVETVTDKTDEVVDNFQHNSTIIFEFYLCKKTTRDWTVRQD